MHSDSRKMLESCRTNRAMARRRSALKPKRLPLLPSNKARPPPNTASHEAAARTKSATDGARSVKPERSNKHHPISSRASPESGKRSGLGSRILGASRGARSSTWASNPIGGFLYGHGSFRDLFSATECSVLLGCYGEILKGLMFGA